MAQRLLSRDSFGLHTVVWALVLILIVVAIGSRVSLAHAEEDSPSSYHQIVEKVRKGEISDSEAINQIRSKVEMVSRSCRWDDYMNLNLAVSNIDDYYSSKRSTAEYKKDSKKYWEIYKIESQYRNFNIDLASKCRPDYNANKIKDFAKQCKLADAKASIPRLEWIASVHQQELDAASSVGPFARKDLNLTELTKTARWSKRLLDEARQAIKEAEIDCWRELNQKKPAEEAKKVGDARAGGEEVLPGDEPGTQPENVCYEPDNEQLASQCGNLEPLLGRWTNRKYGGAIELKLESDGTLSGYVVSTNQIMDSEGYTAGMQILRGWKYGGSNGVTWQVWAKDGQFFSAVKPKRKPGQVWGDAQWIKNGAVLIEKSLPGEITLPALLEGRLGNYAEWVKMGSVGPEV